MSNEWTAAAFSSTLTAALSCIGLREVACAGGRVHSGGVHTSAAARPSCRSMLRTGLSRKTARAAAGEGSGPIQRPNAPRNHIPCREAWLKRPKLRTRGPKPAFDCSHTAAVTTAPATASETMLNDSTSIQVESIASGGTQAVSIRGAVAPAAVRVLRDTVQSAPRDMVCALLSDLVYARRQDSVECVPGTEPNPRSTMPDRNSVKSCALGFVAHAIDATANAKGSSSFNTCCRPRGALHGAPQDSTAAEPCPSTPTAVGSTGQRMPVCCSTGGSHMIESLQCRVPATRRQDFARAILQRV